MPFFHEPTFPAPSRVTTLTQLPTFPLAPQAYPAVLNVQHPSGPQYLHSSKRPVDNISTLSQLEEQIQATASDIFLLLYHVER